MVIFDGFSWPVFLAIGHPLSRYEISPLVFLNTVLSGNLRETSDLILNTKVSLWFDLPWNRRFWTLRHNCSFGQNSCWNCARLPKPVRKRFPKELAANHIGNRLPAAANCGWFTKCFRRRAGCNRWLKRSTCLFETHRQPGPSPDTHPLSIERKTCLKIGTHSANDVSMGKSH